MLKDLFKKSEDEKDKKRQIENIVVFIIILIVTVLIINNMWSGEDTESKEEIPDPTKVLAKTDSSQQDNLEDNLDAIMSVIKHIYNTIMYAELNTKSDYCQVCGYDREIEIKEREDGELYWCCPNCGNTDQKKMNVTRRTCGLTLKSPR